MKPSKKQPQPEATTEILLLPDGQVLVHNLTPTMAAILAELNPNDRAMKIRSAPVTNPEQNTPNQHP